MPSGISLIPSPITPASPSLQSPRIRPKDMAGRHSPRMRYTPADLEGSPSRMSGGMWPSLSQALIQSWYSKGKAAAEVREMACRLVELEDLAQQIDAYDNDNDLARFGSPYRIHPRKASAVFSAEELIQLPCDLRDAKRALTATIARLKKGEQLHPNELNFDGTRALLDRLGYLDLFIANREKLNKLPQIAERNSNASDSALRSVASPCDSLGSCDLPPLSWDGSSADDLPAPEHPLSPLRGPNGSAPRARSRTSSIGSVTSGIPVLLGRQWNRMARTAQHNFSLQRFLLAQGTTRGTVGKLGPRKT